MKTMAAAVFLVMMGIIIAVCAGAFNSATRGGTSPVGTSQEDIELEKEFQQTVRSVGDSVRFKARASGDVYMFATSDKINSYIRAAIVYARTPNPDFNSIPGFRTDVPDFHVKFGSQGRVIEVARSVTRRCGISKVKVADGPTGWVQNLDLELVK